MNNFQVFHQHVSFVGQSVNIILIFFIFPPPSLLCKIDAGFTVSMCISILFLKIKFVLKSF